MQDGMSQRDGVSMSLGCGHNETVTTEDGKKICRYCGDEMDSARDTEQDERSGADISNEAGNGQV